MNETTELNSELLSADARGRKHIPVAVFAVILIHVVLFVVLLIAAGCRSSARVKATQPGPERGVHPTQQYMHAAASTEGAGQLMAAGGEKVVVMEPLEEEAKSSEAENSWARNARLAERRSQTPATVPNASVATGPRNSSLREVPAVRSGSRGRSPSQGREPVYYVVQSGDTVGEIAQKHGTTIEAIKAANKLKNHLIYPGQKLLLKPGGATSGSTAQLNDRRSRNKVSS